MTSTPTAAVDAGPATGPERRRWAGITGAIFVLLMLVRVPSYLTHHIQEDSFITWRCARSLATTGVYGFNPGERVSACTSHAYAGLCTLVMLACREHFISVILWLNAAMFLAGTLLICRRIFPDPGRAR